MNINLETEVVSTAYANRVHTYVIERKGRRWTVNVPDDEYAKLGPMKGMTATQNKDRRRMFLAQRLAAAMNGPSDE